MRLQPVLLLAGLLATPAFAQDTPPGDAPSKRSEGRYFIELSEIMLSANDFDMEIGSITPTGARAGEPVEMLRAELSNLEEQPPRVTMGLNRPLGKTTLEFHVHDFRLKDERILENFNAEDQVVHSNLLAPGVVFQRQQPQPPDQEAGTDFVPNYGNEIIYIRRADYRGGGFTALHNIKETERARLRWLGGLRYAELDQGISSQMSFTKERVNDNSETQDFFGVQAKTNTHGFGPNAGLDGRFFLDKKRKKFSIEARGEVSFIPESTTARYAVSMTDNSGEGVYTTIIDPPGSPPGTIIQFFENNTEAPIIPGLGSSAAPGDPFNAIVTQTDYTEMTYLLEGRVGFRWQASKYFTLGLDAWGLSWSNVLSDVGVLDTVFREATYQQLPGDPTASDPTLRDGESVIHLPRFDKREDYTFQGVSLSMKFDF